jgi:hypothetical protein
MLFFLGAVNGLAHPLLGECSHIYACVPKKGSRLSCTRDERMTACAEPSARLLVNCNEVHLPLR